MGKRKGVAAPQHTEEQKIALAKQVCDLYESQNCTLESACNEVGMPMRTFHLWNAQIAEIAEYYKKAKENADEFYWQELLRPKLKTSLQLLVEGFDDKQEVEEDVYWQGVAVKDSISGETLRKNKVTKSRVAPNPTSVIFGMKVVFPEKTKDRADVTSDGKQIGQNPLDGLSIEDKAQILRILLKKDADR
jgi:hypothetical protein